MSRLIIAWIVLFGVTLAGPPAWQPQGGATAERLRGVSAVSDRVAWASGNRGTIIRTVDGGATWTATPVPGAEALDFRDIEAFDASTAVALSIGPGDKSRIYRTTDGGATWTAVFTSPDPRAFYDAIAFWNATTGLAFGDPVDGRFTVIRTTDGGRTWTSVPAAGLPPAIEGEGAFAASGTCLVVQGTRQAWFGTGGAARARVFRSADQGLTWAVADTPIAAGTPSAGVFSLAFADAVHGIAAGGDYKLERDPGDNLAVTSDGGATWARAGATRFRGFRSAVAFAPGTGGRMVLAAGPAGSDWSSDGGRTWVSLGGPGFHAIAFARDGSAAWGVGEQGRVAKLTGLAIGRGIEDRRPKMEDGRWKTER